MSAISEVVVAIRSQVDGLKSGLSEARSGIEGMGQSMQNVGKQVSDVGMGMTKMVTGPIVGLAAGLTGLAKGFSNTGVQVSKYAAQAGLGVEAYQHMTYWGEQNNVATQDMNRALGRLNQRMGRAADGNEKYTKALEGVGVNMDDVRNGTLSTEDAMMTAMSTLAGMTNEQERSAVASELFGTQLARRLLPALQDGSMTMEEARKEAEELGLIMSEDAVQAAMDFDTSWTRMTNVMKGMFLPIAVQVMEFFNNQLFPAIQERMLPAIVQFGEFLGKLGERFNSLNSSVQNSILIISGIAAAIGPTLVVAGKFITSIGKLAPLFSALLGPVGIAIGVLTGLSLLFVALWNNSEAFRDGVIGAFERIKSAVMGFITPWVEAFSYITGGYDDMREQIEQYGGSVEEHLGQRTMSAVSTIRNAIGGVRDFISGVVDRITDLWNRHGDTLLSTVIAGYELIRSGVSEVLSYIGGLIGTALENITSFWDQHGATVTETVMNMVDRVRDALTNLVESVGPIWESLKNLFSSLKPILTLIASVVGGVLVTAWGLAISIFNAAVSAIGPLINAVVNLVDMVVNTVLAIASFIYGDWSAAWDYLGKAGEQAINFLKNIWTGIANFFKNLVTSIYDYFHGLYMTLVGNSIIPDMVNAIVKWFGNLVKWVIDFVRGLVDGVIDWFRNLSSEMNTVFDTIADIIQSVWSYIQDTFSNALSFLSALVSGDFQGMRDAINNQMQNVRELISNIWNSIRSFFAEILTSILSNIRERFLNMLQTITDRINNTRERINSVWTAIQAFFATVLTTIITNVRERFQEMVSNITDRINQARETVNSVLNAISTIFSTILSTVLSTVTDRFNSVRSTIDSVLTAARNIVSNMLNNIRDTFQNIFSSLRDTVTSSFENVRDAVQKGMDAALNVITSMFDSFREAGRGLIDMVVQGIGNAASSVTEAVTGVMQSARDLLPFSPAKEGPMSDLDKLDFGGPMAKSIEKGEKPIAHAMRELMQSVKDEIDKALKDSVQIMLGFMPEFKDVGKTLGEEIAEGIRESMESVKSASRDIAEEARKAGSSVSNAHEQTFNDTGRSIRSALQDLGVEFEHGTTGFAISDNLDGKQGTTATGGMAVSRDVYEEALKAVRSTGLGEGGGIPMRQDRQPQNIEIHQTFNRSSNPSDEKRQQSKAMKNATRDWGFA
ncbi:DUF4239 domain-containing protein [Geomicrobium sp. JCM 19039]|uniref:DUF4239 domain-containing protein n=1 Tax=Geomicrobium sp. JCM 19039 TaxID=1460636 RepID=UPI00045F2F51|nr:DUF4239 domain-containing protein [Geomicrobium sp. JCM 19039]GAK12248.1 hypothetical protein JCM19039_2003 [Geomicrobium sp. JCM 19039]